MIDKLPTEFIEKYQKLLGTEADAFFASYEKTANQAFRINPLKDNVQLTDTKMDSKIPYGEYGFYGATSGHSVDYTTGLIYPQEASAQFVVEAAHIQPGMKVLDMSAAPGGKSTQIASYLKNDGLLWANEIILKRAKVLAQNIERWGAQNVIVTNNSASDLKKSLTNYFDVIILDAPCSGEGMFRKDPEAIKYWNTDYPAECATLQREIIDDVLPMLKVGGTLVYSTCTFSPEENEQTISWLLEKYPNFKVQDIAGFDGISFGRADFLDREYSNDIQAQIEKTVRFWPHKFNGEGHFVAKLSKETNTSDEEQVALEGLKTKLTANELKLINDFVANNLQNIEIAQDFYRIGDRVFAVPFANDLPKLKKINILRLGIELGSFKKNRFEPAHALAMQLSSNNFKQVYALSKDEWKLFVHGDVLQIANDNQYQNGWILLTIDGRGVGIGKLVANQIKNFYPKGLRFLYRE